MIKKNTLCCTVGISYETHRAYNMIERVYRYRIYAEKYSNASRDSSSAEDCDGAYERKKRRQKGENPYLPRMISLEQDRSCRLGFIAKN